MPYNGFRINNLGDANQCIRDLVALSTLPALWAGGDMQRIADGVGDALFGMLRPILVYTNLKDATGQTAAEVARTGNGLLTPADTSEAARVLSPWLKVSESREARVIYNPIGAGMARILVVPIGLNAQFGYLAAVSQLINFPNDAERLLLNVAANQAAIAVQNVHLLAALAHSEAHSKITLSLTDRVRKLLHDDANDLARIRADLADLLGGGESDEAEQA